MMPVFSVVRKTHKEEPGDVHKYSVNLRSPEGHTMKLVVDEAGFESFLTGDTISVAWSPYQRKLEEVARP